MCVCVCVCVYVCTYAYMYMRIYIYIQKGQWNRLEKIFQSFLKEKKKHQLIVYTIHSGCHYVDAYIYIYIYQYMAEPRNKRKIFKR
jgi:hypothetical protein